MRLAAADERWDRMAQALAPASHEAFVDAHLGLYQSSLRPDGRMTPADGGDFGREQTGAPGAGATAAPSCCRGGGCS